MGITGPQWSFPWYRNGIQKALGTYQPKAAEAKEKPSKGKTLIKPESPTSTVSISSLLMAADAQLPYKGDYTIRFPEEEKSPIIITKNKSGFFAPAAADKVLMNAANGQIIKTDIFTNKPFNERVAGSIKAIHTGSVYGTFTKLLYFFACLIATTLPVTGTLIWFNKLQKKKKRNNTKVTVPKLAVSYES
jgi:uncharacterized iron-regulated membrane protein